jgi:dCMP deaminase
MFKAFSTEWSCYFFNIAKVVALKSKDPSTKVGCVLVNKDKQIVSTGYNGFPKRMSDTIDRYIDRPFKLTHVCHAEANAVCQAASTGCTAKDTVAFITLQPCMECAKLLIQAGVVEIHFLINEEYNKRREEQLKNSGASALENWRDAKDAVMDMLKECGVRVVCHYETTHSTIPVDIYKTTIL